MKVKKLLLFITNFVLISSLYGNSCPKFVLIPYDSLLIPVPIYDKSITEPDLDCDEISDSLDDDIDGDGVANEFDTFPRDALESIDTDNDGIGNNADTDDDNDGYSDSTELAEGTDPLDANSHPSVSSIEIILNGEQNITMYLNQIYVEENATAYDEEDGNLTVHISGEVNASVLGDYNITYEVEDSDGNRGIKIRQVKVILPPTPSELARGFVDAYLEDDTTKMGKLTSQKTINKLKTIDTEVKHYFSLIVAYPSMKYFHDLKALVVGVAIENGEEKEIKFYFNSVGSHWILLEVL